MMKSFFCQETPFDAMMKPNPDLLAFSRELKQKGEIPINVRWGGLASQSIQVGDMTPENQKIVYAVSSARAENNHHQSEIARLDCQRSTNRARLSGMAACATGIGAVTLHQITPPPASNIRHLDMAEGALLGLTLSAAALTYHFSHAAKRLAQRVSAFDTKRRIDNNRSGAIANHLDSTGEGPDPLNDTRRLVRQLTL